MGCCQQLSLGTYPSCSGSPLPSSCIGAINYTQKENASENTKLKAATSTIKMCSQLHCDELTTKDPHSPRAVMADLGTHDSLYHFGLSLNGSVEVEIASDLAIRLEEGSFFEGGGSESDRPDSSIAAIAAAPSLPPGRHRKSQSLTSFPSHIPFPQLEEKVEDKKSYLSPLEVNSDAWRTHQVIKDLEAMTADSDEQEYLASAASTGINSILATMRLHTANSRVQRYGFGVLQKLACQSDTNRALIVEAGATADIISAMELHLAKSCIQESGCLALTSLAARGSALIAKQDGIKAILDGMRLHRRHGAVQRHGCHALLCLACSNTDRNSQIANLGGIDVIMAAISDHSEDCRIREYGSAALWSLAYMNTKNKAAIEVAGGMDALFDILNYIDNTSSEDRCLQLIASQESGEDSEQDHRCAKRAGVEDIMSVFVRPLQ